MVAKIVAPDAPIAAPDAEIRGASSERAEGTPNRERHVPASSLTQSGDDDDVARPAGGVAAMLRQPKVAIGVGAVVFVALISIVVMAMRGGGSGSGGHARKSGDQTGGHDEIAGGVNDPRQPGAKAPSGSNMRLDEERKSRVGFGSAGSAVTEPGEGSASEAPPPPEPDVGEGSAAAGSTTGSAAAAGSAAGSTAGSTTGSAATVQATPVKRPTPTLGGKKVVLEYDSQASTAKKPAVAPAGKATVATADNDAASIGAARITYFDGNRKLFAGDADAAIKLYRQALGMYPGYVAGYRGLGLAYAQKGDKANALKAFKTYIAAVPNAKDVALIKKRIATLH